MSAWDWLSTGLDVASTIINIGEGKDQARNQSVWANFNRTRDVKDLMLFLQQQKAIRAQNETRLGHIRGTDAAIRSMQSDLLDAEKDYYTQRRSLALGTSRHEADKMYDTGLAQIEASRARLNSRISSISGQTRVLDATRREIEQEEFLAEQRTASRQKTLDESMGALAAQRAELEATATARMAARQEEAAIEIGAAATSQAARGFTGSFMRTEEDRIQSELSRDVGVLGAQRSAQEAQLDVSMARLQTEQAEMGGQQALNAARRERRTGQLDIQETQLRGEQVALGAESRLLEQRYDYLSGDVDIVRARGEIEGLAHSFGGRPTDVGKGQLQKEVDRAELETMNVTSQIEHSDEVAEIAKWSLENLPPVPDYVGAAGASAAGSLMALGGRIAERM